MIAGVLMEKAWTGRFRLSSPKRKNFPVLRRLAFGVMLRRMDVLDLNEAADLLRVSERTVRTKAKAGLLPGTKVGRDWRFSRAALLKYLEGKPKPKVETVTRTVSDG